jgi:phosphocarrier protein HPr
MNTMTASDISKPRKRLTHPNKAPGPTMRQTFVLKNVHGLHARPSALLVRTLQPFACQATVEHDGHPANARSILSLLSLAAGYDSSLTFTFQGSDASKALMAVKHLFDTQFGEAYQ